MKAKWLTMKWQQQNSVWMDKTAVVSTLCCFELVSNAVPEIDPLSLLLQHLSPVTGLTPSHVPHPPVHKLTLPVLVALTHGLLAAQSRGVPRRGMRGEAVLQMTARQAEETLCQGYRGVSGTGRGRMFVELLFWAPQEWREGVGCDNRGGSTLPSAGRVIDRVRWVIVRQRFWLLCPTLRVLFWITVQVEGWLGNGRGAARIWHGKWTCKGQQK